MDGLLVIDKPSGPTSHDVVARLRRVLNETRVGHTGTLDPAATGVLPLVVGRATRLARFLSCADKSYEAVVRLGIETDSYDATGAPVGLPVRGVLPTRGEVDRTLDAFRGTFSQQPPAFSAKKIGGRRSHRLARAHARGEERSASEGPALPAPVSVTCQAIEVIGMSGDLVTLRVDCSAGFYVRSLAHDLGSRLGIGGHLVALRRTRSGSLTLDDAMSLEAVERTPGEAARRVVPLGRMLPDLPSIVLTPEGVQRATHGRDLGPAEGDGDFFDPASRARLAVPIAVRLVDPEGQLVGIAEPATASGLLHPSVVLV